MMYFKRLASFHGAVRGAGLALLMVVTMTGPAQARDACSSPLPNTLSQDTIQKLSQFCFKKALTIPPLTLSGQRAENDKVQREMTELQLSRYDVTIEEGEIAGVPVKIFTPASGVTRDDQVLLNFHGGGFLVDSGSNSENIPIAALTGRKVITALYRLSPEVAFPAAVDDAEAVYRELLTEYDPGNIVVYGTSAGGILSSELMVRLHKVGLPMPRAMGFFAALADFSRVGDSMSVTGGQIDSWGLSQAMSGYIGGTPTTDPELSPIFADISYFPPTLAIAGTRDELSSGTQLFHRALVHAGVDSNLVMFEAMPHAHWAYLDLEESTEAFQLMADFFVGKLEE